MTGGSTIIAVQASGDAASFENALRAGVEPTTQWVKH